MANIDSLTASDVTHNLHCSHVQGRSVSNYRMKCVLLDTVKSGKAKVLVFGERHWKDRDHIKRIRYVDFDRLTLIRKD